MTEISLQLEQWVALAEWRLASVGTFAVCFAAAFGLHTVWTALDAAGRNLVQNKSYLALIRPFIPEGATAAMLYEPLVRTRKVFFWAILLWSAAALDTIFALGVVPAETPSAGTVPTWHAVIHILLVLSALIASVHAWWVRLKIDAQVHRLLGKSDAFAAYNDAAKGGNERVA